MKREPSRVRVPLVMMKNKDEDTAGTVVTWQREDTLTRDTQGPGCAASAE